MERRIRVCFVASKFSPAVGGAERRTEKQARQLRAQGHEVIVLTLRLQKRWRRQEEIDGLPVIRIGGIYRRSGYLRIGRIGIWPATVGLLWKLWRLRHRYDVIHVMQLSPLAAASVLVGHIARKPVVISIMNAGPDPAQRSRLGQSSATMTVDDGASSTVRITPRTTSLLGDIGHMPRSALGGGLLLNYVRKSNAVYQTLSTRNHEILAAHGFPPERIHHISGSVDTRIFRPNPERRPDPEAGKRVVVCVARLSYEKGIDILLHAWAHVMQDSSSRGSSLQPMLRLVGRGPLRSNMEQLARELGISDSVEFAGMRTDIVDVLQSAWGFVLPSLWEGMPNALLEAMACGLPCVATRVSGSEDIICDGVDGLLAEPEQPVELAQALGRIINDAELAQRLGREGRAKVVRDFQLTDVVNQCVALYRSLLSEEMAGPLVAEPRHDVHG